MRNYGLSGDGAMTDSARIRRSAGDLNPASRVNNPPESLRGLSIRLGREMKRKPSY